MTDILEFQNVTKEFPGVKALQNVNFQITKGEVHGLVGENGAGKSTLMKILSGVYQPTTGDIYLEGDKVNFTNPKQAQNLGVSIIHQEFSLIPYLNAVDNIYLGREIRKGNGLLNKALMKERTKETLHKLNAHINIDTPVANLSIAEQQFIEIAKAISIDCKILIFDEPTASLTGKEVEDLFRLIDTLKAEGVTIIYISHHLEEILRMCDRITCLRDGEWVNSKSISETNKDDMVKMMVGRDVNNNFPASNTSIENNEQLLAVKRLSNDYVNNVQFTIKKGEILGIAGLVGSGELKPFEL
ncbi:ABC transporter [Gracilibacillus halophilus YIM-C55.5]|uniref:ABC transporter n=1 Tax=Gracilibacillus halophilus YIM-C55.5 TaxID=1308866 RepID=N4WR11_9BACI|nr:sugar ABC transporter ATP-binding protein [Gracilibacillus halophilus]ENH96880.1 ABC transporter [Gracilibacillus halophilus YIM-C55.5]